MKIVNILFSEGFIELPTDQPQIIKTALVNPTVSFTPPFFPTSFTFCILLMMQGIPEKPTKLFLEIKNPAKQIIFKAENMISFDEGNNKLLGNLPRDLIGMNFATQINNVVIEQSGEYICTYTLDGGESKSEKLYFLSRNATK